MEGPGGAGGLRFPQKVQILCVYTYPKMLSLPQCQHSHHQWWVHAGWPAPPCWLQTPSLLSRAVWAGPVFSDGVRSSRNGKIFKYWTPYFWKNPPQSTTCVSSDAKHSTAQVLCLTRRVECIILVEQCGVLGILCHTGGSLQEGLLALRINRLWRRRKKSEKGKTFTRKSE